MVKVSSVENRAETDPVKLFAAVLWFQEDALAAGMERMRRIWGETDFEGSDRLFDVSHYYDEEMGSGLQRRIVSFTELVQPDSIVSAKILAGEIEENLRGPAGRRLNLDMGYMDIHKVVLASAKYGPQKIYLGRGVYADIVCRYSKGTFHPYEWSFPDFRDGRYNGDLLTIRTRLKAQLRASR